MEDKRIRKTKKNLKQTLISLLNQKSFNDITVTEICKVADTSRITFYYHYSDKYELADDIFQDLIHKGYDKYAQLQSENNIEHSFFNNYGNMLDSILDIYFEYSNFFKHTNPSANSYLTYSFHEYILKIVENHLAKEQGSVKLKYTPKEISYFLCYGLYGFINESSSDKQSFNQQKKKAKEILISLLKSEVLTENRFITPMK